MFNFLLISKIGILIQCIQYSFGCRIKLIVVKFVLRG